MSDFDVMNAYLRQWYEDGKNRALLASDLSFAGFREWALFWRWKGLRESVEEQLPDWTKPRPSSPDAPTATGIQDN